VSFSGLELFLKISRLARATESAFFGPQIVRNTKIPRACPKKLCKDRNPPYATNTSVWLNGRRQKRLTRRFKLAPPTSESCVIKSQRHPDIYPDFDLILSRLEHGLTPKFPKTCLDWKTHIRPNKLGSSQIDAECSRSEICYPR
jgi:hypothetical protein